MLNLWLYYTKSITSRSIDQVVGCLTRQLLRRLGGLQISLEICKITIRVTPKYLQIVVAYRKLDNTWNVALKLGIPLSGQLNEALALFIVTQGLVALGTVEQSFDVGLVESEGPVAVEQSFLEEAESHVAEGPVIPEHRRVSTLLQGFGEIGHSFLVVGLLESGVSNALVRLGALVASFPILRASRCVSFHASLERLFYIGISLIFYC